MENSESAPGRPPDLKRQSENEKVIASRTLFGERKEVAIEHDGALYRLKITKQGKLILNK